MKKASEKPDCRSDSAGRIAIAKSYAAGDAYAHLAIDRAERLWVTVETNARVAAYAADGSLLVDALPLPQGSVPNGLGLDREGHLLVCDNGPRQQVLVFDVSVVSALESAA